MDGAPSVAQKRSQPVGDGVLVRVAHDRLAFWDTLRRLTAAHPDRCRANGAHKAEPIYARHQAGLEVEERAIGRLKIATNSIDAGCYPSAVASRQIDPGCVPNLGHGAGIGVVAHAGILRIHADARARAIGRTVLIGELGAA